MSPENGVSFGLFYFILLLMVAGWIIAAMFAGLFWSERDRRLHAEGARYHKFQATKLKADPGSDADAQRQIREAEVRVAATRIQAAARLGGKVIGDDEARAEAERLLNKAFGTG